jgi:hypothetical protein
MAKKKPEVLKILFCGEEISSWNRENRKISRFLF